MKMIVAVVRDEFGTPLAAKLSEKGFGTTKLASTGGFLKSGNSTFLIGVPVAQVDEAMELIQATVAVKKPNSKGSNASQSDGMKVAGATVFVLEIANMIKV